MRRAAILLVSLSILSISALALAGALVDSRRADAYFESELLCGERDSFEGVPISASSCLSGLIGNYLCYGLRYDAAADESACEYSFNERTSRSAAADTDNFIQPAQRRHIHPKSAPDPHRFLPRCPPAASRRRRSAR